MAITYYTDSAGSNTAPYDTWAKAATSIQTIYDLAVAGDTCYARGTQTLAAPIDIDTQTGDLVTGLIKFIGCNAGGTVDGTRFVLDGNNAAANCLLTTDKDYIWHENFELKQATGSNFDATGAADHWYWINCISHNAGSHGWDMTGCDYHHSFRCNAYSNGADGWRDPASRNSWFFCAGYDNTGDGWDDGPVGTNLWVGCIGHNNVTGWDSLNFYGVVVNCVADGNSVSGIDVFMDHCILLMNRITNHSGAGDMGVDNGGELTLLGWNLFHNNDDDIANEALRQFIPLDGDADTNEYDPNADDGYNAQATDDFNLKASRTYNGDGTHTIDMNIGS